MNRIFKTVWNAVRRCLVVVNEATKSTAQARQRGRIIKKIVPTLVGSSLATSALAGHDYAILYQGTYSKDYEITYTTIHIADGGGPVKVNNGVTLKINLRPGSEQWGFIFSEGDSIQNHGTVIFDGNATWYGHGGIYMDWGNGNNYIYNYSDGTISIIQDILTTTVQTVTNEGTINNNGIWNNNVSRGSKTTNSGIFNNSGTINSSQTWAGSGQINNTGGTVNISGGTFTTNTLVGGQVNLSGGNVTVNQIHDTTHYTLTGGNLTTAFNQIVANAGSMGQQALNYIPGTIANVVQSVQTLWSDYFQKYEQGSLRQNLGQIASFKGGKLVVTGSNLTTTQRDDLTKIFKETFAATKYQEIIPSISLFSAYLQYSRLV